MTDAESQSAQTAAKPRSRWALAMTFTAVVTVAGFVVALQQFTVKYLYDESPHTRTLGGLLYMLLGLAGLYLPFRLLRRRKQFADLSPARQWFAVLGVPLLYLLAFAACVEASLRSTTMILPKPFTQIVVVTYDGSGPQDFRKRTGMQFRNALRENHLTGGHGHKFSDDGAVERFRADYDKGFLRSADRLPIATFDGETRRLEDGRVQISIDVDAKEPLRFSVRGLERVEMTRDGKPIDQSDENPGKYTIVIVGRPTEEK